MNFSTRNDYLLTENTKLELLGQRYFSSFVGAFTLVASFIVCGIGNKIHLCRYWLIKDFRCRTYLERRGRRGQGLGRNNVEITPNSKCIFVNQETIPSYHSCTRWGWRVGCLQSKRRWSFDEFQQQCWFLACIRESWECSEDLRTRMTLATRVARPG